MRKLDKHTLENRDGLIDRFRDRYSDLDEAVVAYNSTVAAAWRKVQEAMNDWNEIIDDANAWKQEIAQEIDDYMAARSEKWQESDKAREYEAWKAEFEDDYEHVEFDEPDELDLANIENYEELMGELPEGLD